MPASSVVLTLGRLPVALDLARSFADLGFRVVVADPLGMHLCRMSRAVARSVKVRDPSRSPDGYLDDVLRVIDEESAGLVIPVSEETVRIAALREQLPDDVTLFSPSREAVLELHDKYRFACFARDNGLDAPASALPGENRKPPAEHGLVIKRRYSCSGRDIRFVDRYVEPDRGEFIQQRIAGDELSAFAVARNGRVVALSSYRARIRSGSVAVCFESVHDDAVRRWVERFVDLVGHTGFIAFDFIRDANGKVWAIECNPRATSGIHFIPCADLAGLVLGRIDTASPATGLLTEFWSGLSALFGQLPKIGAIRRDLRTLQRAQDVSWDSGDPWPFLLMPVNTAPLLVRALLARRTVAEVAVRELEWKEPADEH